MFKKSAGSKHVVKTETKTTTKENGAERITIKETIETFSDGSVQKSTETLTETMSSTQKITQNCSNFSERTINSSSITKALPSKAFSPSSQASNGAPAKPVKAEDFQKDALKCHNQYRQKHGIAPLKLNSKLCAYAQEWANHLASTRSFKHRSDHKYGENIYSKMTSDPSFVLSGSEPVESWYSEIKDYRFGSSGWSSGTGHFTQVVWKGSNELGIAYAKAPGGWYYVVANYDPAGNMMGSFNENVFAPKK